MCKVMLQRVRELWAVVTDRRHAADNEAKRAALKDEWLKLSRILVNMRNRRGKLMPGWVTVRLEPICTIKSQLGQCRKLRRLQVVTGGQRGIMSYATHTRTARRAQIADDGPAAAATAQLRHQRPRPLGRPQRRLRLASCDGWPASAQPSRRTREADRTTTTTPMTARGASPRL